MAATYYNTLTTDAWLAETNKMRKYLGQKPLKPDKDGEIRLLGNEGPIRSEEIYSMKNGVGICRTFEYSPHNGDIYDRSTKEMDHKDLMALLKKLTEETRRQVARKVKQELEDEAVSKRMCELGFYPR